MNQQSFFKTCGLCGFKWRNREEFLSDKNVVICGYQVHFEQLENGLFLFNHSCGTTLSLPIIIFRDLYKGEIFEERKTGLSECPGYCLHTNELRPCPAKCECAYVREITQIISQKKTRS